MCLSKRVIQVLVWRKFITGTWCLISVLEIKPWAVQALCLCVPMRLSPGDNTQRRSGPLLFGTLGHDGAWSICRMSTTVGDVMAVWVSEARGCQFLWEIVCTFDVFFFDLAQFLAVIHNIKTSTPHWRDHYICSAVELKYSTIMHSLIACALQHIQA